MGLGEEVTEIIAPEVMLPAPGQGIIAIECREDDVETMGITRAINHTETEYQAISERAFLLRLGGDCNVPVGCYALLSMDSINLRGIISSPDGKVIIKKEANGPVDEALELGGQLAELVLADGGDKILEELSHS
jgi:hydroxymethylbilane synthase